MSTFKEYLEKTTKENQGIKNTKIKGGDEVVNESEGTFYASILKVLKKFEQSDEENFTGIHDFHFEEVAQEINNEIERIVNSDKYNMGL